MTLSRPIFLYVNATSLARSEVAAFATFYAANAARLARDAKYVPLSDSTYQSNRERLRRRIAGSLWNGAVPVVWECESCKGAKRSSELIYTSTFLR